MKQCITESDFARKLAHNRARIEDFVEEMPRHEEGLGFCPHIFYCKVRKADEVCFDVNESCNVKRFYNRWGENYNHNGGK